MVTIPVRVFEELAKQMAPFQDRLDQIIELGLQRWNSSNGRRSTRRGKS